MSATGGMSSGVSAALNAVSNNAGLQVAMAAKVLKTATESYGGAAMALIQSVPKPVPAATGHNVDTYA